MCGFGDPAVIHFETSGKRTSLFLYLGVEDAIMGTKPKKRLTSKVWGSTGTTSLWNHQARCNSGIQKRPKLHEHTSLPSTKKSTALTAADVSDRKQKKLPFLLSSYKKDSCTLDATPDKDLALPDSPINTNRKNQAVDQNESHKEFATHEQNNLVLPVIPTDKNKKSQGVDQNISNEELIRILAMDGHATRMVEQDDFGKLVAHLNPIAKPPSHYDLRWKTFDLFKQEKSKLKEKLTALSCQVCLSACLWHYDPLLACLCLTVHYIDDEWEKQQKIIAFCSKDPSCSAEELTRTILWTIGDWGLDDKIFSIILDNAFIDDSVALNVKVGLQKRNKDAAKRSLFAARYATHLLDEVIKVGLNELDTIMERSTKSSRYKMVPIPSLAHYPNCRYAPSVDNWIKAQKICDMLEDFHMYKESMHKFPRPDNLFDKVWNVKEKVHHNTDIDRFKTRREVYLRDKEEEGLYLMSDIDDYIGDVHDTLLDLYSEYSNQMQEPDCTSGSEISTGDFIGRDILHELYLHTEYPYGQRPLTELDHYLQEARIATGESSVLQWWKEQSLTYPTIGRMARNILALPSSTDCKAATRTARLVMSVSGNANRVEKLVCIQDWLTAAGTTSVE
ncbi:hypothetical protein U9M48_014300 [Paspalum notatum var. saurae]|uniref:HAT C-terminal dimerisation domain-containing protein n=1 Tax=Paspalum notatum var. saurae TaxID=547442 RepID=A0AAQ3T1R6_PASNO